MPLKVDIVNFLRTNSELKKVNFGFSAYKVYPTGYTVDVANLIDKEFITAKTAYFWPVAASYMMDSDKLIVKNSFNITNDDDLSYLVHECTHALMDYQKMGLGSPFDHEAVAYLAEAMWREAGGLGSLGGTSIRTVSHRIAKSLLATGSYTVGPADVSDLIKAVKAEPHYAKLSDYESDGIK
jgi:hypothetical protein